MNSCSSSACGSLQEPYASICQAIVWEVPANAVSLNAGPRLSATRREVLWRVTSAAAATAPFGSSQCFWLRDTKVADNFFTCM